MLVDEEIRPLHALTKMASDMRLGVEFHPTLFAVSLAVETSDSQRALGTHRVATALSSTLGEAGLDADLFAAVVSFAPLWPETLYLSQAPLNSAIPAGRIERRAFGTVPVSRFVVE